MQATCKQTQGKGRDFLGSIVGPAGFTEWSVLWTSRSFFSFFFFFSCDTFLKPTPRVSKRGHGPHPFKGLAQSQDNSWTRTQALKYHISSSALWGQKSKGTRDLSAPVCPQIPRFFLRRSPLMHPNMGVDAACTAGYCPLGGKSHHHSQAGTGTCSQSHSAASPSSSRPDLPISPKST